MTKMWSEIIRQVCEVKAGSVNSNIKIYTFALYHSSVFLLLASLFLDM